MRFPLTRRLLDEAERFQLRCSCADCFFFVPTEERCAHEWPNRDQRRPLGAPGAEGDRPDSAAFCKEFELR